MSINKLGVGHARYYVEQAGERVDAAESIGDGVEEYYTGPSTEARGSWFGAGSRELGLEGEVSCEQDKAVREAIGHVERTAAAVRRGHGGLVVEPAGGLVVGMFRHRTSRVGDPQLHTHAVVANLGRGPDGRWSTLDGRRIYAPARTASFIYQAVLRAELSRELGVQWSVVRRGIAEVAGIPKPVRRAFSRRRVEIEAEMERRGTSGPAASE